MDRRRFVASPNVGGTRLRTRKCFFHHPHRQFFVLGSSSPRTVKAVSSGLHPQRQSILHTTLWARDLGPDTDCPYPVCLSGFGLFQMESAPSVTVINLLSHLVGPRSKTRYEMPLAYPVSRVDSDVSLFVYNPLRASTLTCDHIRIIGRIGVTGKGRAIRN